MSKNIRSGNKKNKREVENKCGVYGSQMGSNRARACIVDILERERRGMQEQREEKIILGIPCKYSDIAIIPKHIFEFFEGGVIIAKCRGEELVTLELIEEYTSTESVNADLRAIFGIGIEEYTLHWEKRVDAENLRKNGWVKVRMRKIETQENEKA